MTFQEDANEEAARISAMESAVADYFGWSYLDQYEITLRGNPIEKVVYMSRPGPDFSYICVLMERGEVWNKFTPGEYTYSVGAEDIRNSRGDRKSLSTVKDWIETR